MIKERSVAVALILTILTCGLYGLYWLVCLNDELNALSDNKNDTSGGVVLLLSLITCGIYSWYWLFKSGEKVDALKVKRGVPTSYSALLYLVLGLFGFTIISYALIQDEINNNIRNAQ